MILQLTDVKKYYEKRLSLRKKSITKAVDGVSLSIKEGETFGLVGESGSGKTTIARLISGMVASTQGSIVFDGKDLSMLSAAEEKVVRKNMGIVFQNPYSSLNPKMSIFEIISEPIDVFEKLSYQEKYERVTFYLEEVGLSREQHLFRYPHEFSGGQRQRIAIARVLAYNPSLVIFDEPTSALDVSIQAQILNLLKRAQQKMNLTFLLISHDMGVIYHMCSKIAVMYLGKIVEMGPVDDVFLDCLHPYTKLLINSIPDVDSSSLSFRAQEKKERNHCNEQLIPGCSFAPRCSLAYSECFNRIPEFREIKPGYSVACHHV